MDWSILINHFKNVGCRIEIEGKKSDILKEGITDFSLDSVRDWEENANKWGVEYRIYFNGNVPDIYSSYVKNNAFFNTDRFLYVINNNELARIMLNNGFRLGDN
ncbi:hypothetical protein [Brachyspira intermedia]|uniref:hypothetical protein n=1 Tax=Brachyspira intermedia TaxID=84377 RepID=UPI003007D480